MSTIVFFLIYFSILYVTNYVLVEYTQRYLYDEVTKALPLKVLGGAVLLGVALTYARTRFDTMFTSELGTTVILAILWGVVFIVVYQFQPWHGAIVGVIAFAILSGIATMAAESLTAPSVDPQTVSQAKRQPIRVNGGQVVQPKK